MNKLTILFGVLLCLAVVKARHYEDREENEGLAEDDGKSDGRRQREHSPGQARHRRRRWQANYGYDYPQPPFPFYYPDRRDHERNDQNLLPQIYKLLDEISTYIKRPPPPPQPIYIPYPVPYPMSQLCSCPSKGTKKPNITSRFPDMEDINQNWGFVSLEEKDDDDSDGSRPISFQPIRAARPMMRPQPEVEHGSSQSASQPITEAPQFSQPSTTAKLPGTCNAAILSCCGTTETKQQRQCFNNMGCGMTYANGNACNPSSISNALDSFQKAYSPVN